MKPGIDDQSKNTNVCDRCAAAMRNNLSFRTRIGVIETGSQCALLPDLRADTTPKWIYYELSQKPSHCIMNARNVLFSTAASSGQQRPAAVCSGLQRATGNETPNLRRGFIDPVCAPQCLVHVRHRLRDSN
jgi:hypothetical protein